MKNVVLILMLFLPFQIFGQTNHELETYLKANRYPILHNNTNSTTSFPDQQLPQMLAGRMKDKILFVYGEGFSHNLMVNGYLELMFIEYFKDKGLKYVFGEQARSWVVMDDLYFKDAEAKAEDFYPDFDPEMIHMTEAFKTVYHKGHFEFKAVDFERRSGFRDAIQLLAHKVNVSNREEVGELMPYVNDSSYMTLSPGKFVSFLEVQRDKFYKDSSRVKEISGDMYAGFRYLLTDPKPSKYTDNRNKNMANHVLWQIGQPGPGDIFIETCGLYHAKRKGDALQKSTVGYLEATNELRGKLLTVSLYCEDCTPKPNQYGIGDNSVWKFMKDDILRSFQQAAGSDDIVLFDLTDLPPKYQYIRKEYVDMLIFAKHQR